MVADGDRAAPCRSSRVRRSPSFFATHRCHAPRALFRSGAASFLVHGLLLGLDVPHALDRVDFSQRAQKSVACLTMSPNGVVPSLVPDGKPQYEAALAMLLAERHPQPRLAPAAVL